MNDSCGHLIKMNLFPPAYSFPTTNAQTQSLIHSLCFQWNLSENAETMTEMVQISERNCDATYTSTYDDVTQSQRGCKSSTNKHAETNLGLFLTKSIIICLDC